MDSQSGVASISILDDIAIHQIFRNLPAHYLAQASCVCRDWNSIAADEALWEDAYRQLDKPAYIANAAQQLDEIAAAVGSWKQVCQWRHRSLHTHGASRLLAITNDGTGKIVTLANEEKEEASLTISMPATLLATDYSSWAPDGKLLAMAAKQRSSVLGSSFRGVVNLVTDAGNFVQRVVLGGSFIPFFMMWSPCGTRIALLSGWHEQGVALRVFEVPLLSTALEALGKGHEERSIARAESTPKVVVLLTGQPLFFTWTPDGTVIIAHARAEELIHLDVNAALEGREFATVFPQRPEFDSFEAPVLLHVRRGMELVETTEDGRQMVLLRAAALVSEPCTLSTQPAQPAAEPPRIALQISEGEIRRKVRLVGSSDGKWVAALSHDGHLQVSSFVSGEAYKLTKSTMSTVCFDLKSTSLVDRTYGRALAAYWSPDSRRLLMLFVGQFTGELRKARVGNQCWVVWEVVEGHMRVSHGAIHYGSENFYATQLPYFDSYAQAQTFWSPASDAFCFPASHGSRDIWPKEAELKSGEPPESNNIFVQRLPESDSALTGWMKEENGILHRKLPMPECVSPGGLATWAQG